MVRTEALQQLFSLIIVLTTFLASGLWAQTPFDGANPPRIVEFIGDQPMTRVDRPFVMVATIHNPAKMAARFTAKLKLPDDVRVKEGERLITLAANEKTVLRWTITASEPLYDEVKLLLTQGQAVLAARSVPVRFLPALKQTKPAYIPEPKTLPGKKILVGAHNCPLWEADKPQMWDQVLYKHPERTPAMGFYAQENPEVADWETKWAVEHGIDYFIYCWYRTSQGGPVEQRFGSAIHDALFKSRFVDKIKFTIMWENQSKGKAGVADENDLLTNLLPFWIENYFKHPSYLKVDNKPLLFIYVPGKIWGPKTGSVLEDLGSVENVKSAFDKMRAECRKVGFDGLTILGEYRGADSTYLQTMKDMGFDYTFAYCWHVQNSPTPQQAIDAQMKNLRTIQDMGIIPQVCTLSQAWSGWRDEGSIWKIPPTEYEAFLRQAKGFIEKLPQDQLSGRMVILDNWNEWSEGHYLLPYTEHGFGYLDAVRKVFTGAPDEHVDLIPEDIGMGGYESAYREFLAKKRLEPEK
jgi:hypothetical protein